MHNTDQAANGYRGGADDLLIAGGWVLIRLFLNVAVEAVVDSVEPVHVQVPNQRCRYRVPCCQRSRF